MFTIGDSAVHPLHGAGVIEEIRSQRVDGTNRDYYIFTVPGSNIMVMVPVESSDTVGLRPVMGEVQARQVMQDFRFITDDNEENWNKRYRDNMIRIKSGDQREVCRVVKSLMRRETVRSLSTGERKILTTARQILFSELEAALGVSADRLEQDLREML